MLCYRTNKSIRTHLVKSKLTPSLDYAVEATPLKEFSLDYTSCHATDGSPKLGPPGPSVANCVAMDGPPGPSVAP